MSNFFFTAITLTFFIGVCLNFSKTNSTIALSIYDIGVRGKRVRRKKRICYVPLKAMGIYRVLLCVYWKTIGVHVRKGGLSSYFVLCTPLGKWALTAGIAVFCLSSLCTILQTLMCVTKSERVKIWSEHFCSIFQCTYEIFTVVMVCIVTVHCTAQISSYLGIDEFFQMAIIPAIGLVTADQEQGQWQVNLLVEYIVKIEENEENYRITIGRLYWLVAKENIFTRLVFAVLIYAAVKRRGREQIIESRTLSQALGFSTKYPFYKLFVKYQKAGNDLSVIVPDAVNAHVKRVRKAALAIWVGDLSLSVCEVRERLREQGMSVSVGLLESIMGLVNFNVLRNALNEKYCKRSEFNLCEAETFEISSEGEHYLIRMGNLYWRIERSHRFMWAALLYLLHQAKNLNGKTVFSIEALSENIVNSKQHLYQLFENFESLAEFYRPLSYVAQKHRANIELSQQILHVWLEDITLSAEKVAKKLIARAIVENIQASVIYNLVRQIDFMEVRRHLKKDYQQGKIRKSAEWTIAKYQKIIDDLITKLRSGEVFSQAEIDSFYHDLPSKTKPQNLPQKSCPSHSNLAWLKCFLFSLPKSLDGKICCPECGQFHTKRKEKIPTPHLVTNPKDGKTTVVDTFRFFCQNPDCERRTFSATADGSHILQEKNFASSCMMLRLVMSVGGSYSAVANLLGTSKSTVFDQLSLIANTADFWGEILEVIRFSGTLCIDEKFVKIAQLKPTKGNRNFAYLFFAIDPKTYDLLHIDIYASRDSKSVEAFLFSIKAQGIYPKVIMTDLFAGYDNAIKKVFGRSVTIAKCHFHFKKNIHKHIYDQFGKNNAPDLADQLRRDIFFVVDALSKKSGRYRRL